MVTPILLLGLFSFPSPARGAGELDPTFDGDGRVLTDFGSSEVATSVAIQADGKIVAAGGVGGGDPSDFQLVRYNPDGSLDVTFDGDGRVVTDFGSSDSALAVAIQADGGIVAAGLSFAGPNPDNFALARYSSDGSLDPTFSGDGRVLTDFGAEDGAYGVAIQADGRIVAVGRSGAGARPDDFALVRYNPNGSLDPTFGGDGRAVTDFGGHDGGQAVAIQSDGRIVAAGFTFVGSDFALARYSTDGSLDATFDGDGRVVTDFGALDEASGIAIQSDRKIVAAGEGTGADNRPDFALARYNPNGSLDATFDGDGRVLTDFGGFDEAGGVAIQADGKLVAAGDSDAGPNRFNFALARYLPNGARPPTLDHFLYYPIEEGTPAFRERTVTVRDQFRTSQARVVEPLRLLNPASKDGGAINRPGAHLKCYRITESRFGGRTVTVQNQFGTRSYEVRQPTRLCNPASKRVSAGAPGPVPSGFSHFRCYGIEGGQLNRPVTLRDQFGRQQAMVGEPEYLCNPASKNGSQIHNPADHLVCYELEGVDPFASRQVSLRDQFGVQSFTVEKPTKLCVPSRKRR